MESHSPEVFHIYLIMARRISLSWPFNSTFIHILQQDASQRINAEAASEWQQKSTAIDQRAKNGSNLHRLRSYFLNTNGTKVLLSVTAELSK